MKCAQCIKYPSPVPDHKLNAGLGRGLQGLVGLVYAPAGTVLTVDLKDLVPKTQPGQGRGGVGLHQLDKHSLRRERGNRQNIQNESREERGKRQTMIAQTKTKGATQVGGGEGRERKEEIK